MSWGYEKTGTRAAVIADATEYFNRVADGYKDLPEANDVRACLGRIVELVEKADLGKTTDGVDWNGVLVKASGSHYWTGRRQRELLRQRAAHQPGPLMILSVVWCATSGERVRHAHISGWRICQPNVRLGSPEYWRDGHGGKGQPVKACKRCQVLLDGVGTGDA